MIHTTAKRTMILTAAVVSTAGAAEIVKEVAIIQSAIRENQIPMPVVQE
jgi:hypothetical protein